MFLLNAQLNIADCKNVCCALYFCDGITPIFCVVWGEDLFFVLFRHLVVEVQTEHKSLVVGVRAANVCALDNAAFEDIGYTHDLAEYRKKAAVFFAISHARFVLTNFRAAYKNRF